MHLVGRCALILLLLALFATDHAAAQPEEAVPPPGTRALLFQATSGINFTSFSGSTLSMKWQRTETRASRLGLSLYGTAVFGGERDDQRAQVALDYLLLTYVETRTAVQFYYGVGPAAEFVFQRQERIDRDAVSITRGGLGAAGVLGVEWFPIEAISIVGEYGTSLTLVYQERLYAEEDESQYGVSVAAQSARVGVSVYF